MGDERQPKSVSMRAFRGLSPFPFATNERTSDEESRTTKEGKTEGNEGNETRVDTVFLFVVGPTTLRS